MKKVLYILFGLVTAGLSSSCTHLFYYPSHEMYFDPKKLHLSPKDIEFESEDGEKIHAWLIEADQKPSKGTILFFHGNAENLTAHYAQLSWLPAQGYSYLIFDYPGYGRSSGEASQGGTVKAGQAALKWAHEYDARPLIIFGQSLGGAIAQKVVVDELKKPKPIPIKGIVLESTFNSYQRIAGGKLALSWVTWIFQPLAYIFVSDRWQAEGLDKISPIPVLVILGQKDTTVEPINGERLFEKLKEPKQIWRIPEGQHTDVFWAHGRKYRQPFIDWLTALDTPNK